LVTDVFGSIDVLLRFQCQKVKGQGHSRWWLRKLCECNVFL